MYGATIFFMLILISEKKVYNERGAGRKPKFTGIEKETIKIYRRKERLFKK